MSLVFSSNSRSLTGDGLLHDLLHSPLASLDGSLHEPVPLLVDVGTGEVHIPIRFLQVLSVLGDDSLPVDGPRTPHGPLAIGKVVITVLDRLQGLGSQMLGQVLEEGLLSLLD